MPNLSDLIKFVTLTATQTPTNKTIALGSNTVFGTTAEFNTALTDNDFATLAGAETLTNKTLASPTLDLANVTSAGDLAVADGGTGASTAAVARTNLGVAIGTDTQAYDAGLQSIAGLTTTSDRMIYTTGADVYAVTPLTSFARTLLDDANASTARATLGVAIGADVQAYDADLDTWATKTAPSGTVVGTTDTQTLSNKTLTAATGVFTNKTSASLGTTGAEMRGDGLIIATTDGQNCMAVNRKTDDGALVSLYQDGTVEGQITVSGTTVSYNNFMGAHYSELDVGNNPLELLRGTIVEATGNLVSQRHTRQQRLSKFKPSATAASKAVYGVVDGPAHQEGDGYPGQTAFEGRNPVRRQYNIAAVGAGFIRIASGATVAVGDLIESAGDGTGQAQADDVIRSSTVGKMTSADIVETYADGSTLRPCVLYCG